MAEPPKWEPGQLPDRLYSDADAKMVREHLGRKEYFNSYEYQQARTQHIIETGTQVSGPKDSPQVKAHEEAKRMRQADEAEKQAWRDARAAQREEYQRRIDNEKNPFAKGTLVWEQREADERYVRDRIEDQKDKKAQGHLYANRRYHHTVATTATQSSNLPQVPRYDQIDKSGNRLPPGIQTELRGNPSTSINPKPDLSSENAQKVSPPSETKPTWIERIFEKITAFISRIFGKQEGQTAQKPSPPPLAGGGDQLQNDAANAGLLSITDVTLNPLPFSGITPGKQIG